MAKKRVHEIAKAKGMTSKEALAKLQAAGLEVKAAASSVEEADALKALNGGNGAAPAEKPAQAAPVATPDGAAAQAPAATEPRPAPPAKPAAAPTPPQARPQGGAHAAGGGRSQPQGRPQGQQPQGRQSQPPQRPGQQPPRPAPPANRPPPGTGPRIISQPTPPGD